jgi:hypothetical protein
MQMHSMSAAGQQEGPESLSMTQADLWLLQSDLELAAHDEAVEVILHGHARTGTSPPEQGAFGTPGDGCYYFYQAADGQVGETSMHIPCT